MLNLDDFKKAHKSISPYINYTPLIHSLELSKNLRQEVDIGATGTQRYRIKKGPNKGKIL